MNYGMPNHEVVGKCDHCAEPIFRPTYISGDLSQMDLSQFNVEMCTCSDEFGFCSPFIKCDDPDLMSFNKFEMTRWVATNHHNNSKNTCKKCWGEAAVRYTSKTEGNVLKRAALTIEIAQLEALKRVDPKACIYAKVTLKKATLNGMTKHTLNTHKSHYRDLIAERIWDPCTLKEQGG